MTEVDGAGCFCRICAPGDDEAGWDDGDRKLVADVKTHGWHVVTVLAEGDSPGWSYSIGLWHSFRCPEIAMFGLRPEDMPIWLNDVGLMAREGAPPRPGERRSDVIDGFEIEWRSVHPSWYPELFGYGLWFAAPPLPYVELVWPDRNGRFPWDEDVGDACRRNQPTCWEPIDGQPPGPWRPMAVHAIHGWPPPELHAFASKRIGLGTTHVCAVLHEADGDWCFMDGGPAAADDIEYVHAAHLVDADPTLALLGDLEVGWEAVRDGPGGAWVRGPIH